MKSYSYSFTAGETKTFPGGRFFIVITAGNAVNVDYFKENRNINESAQSVLSGYYYESKPGDWFDYVQVYSATTQTVHIAVSQAGGGYNIGSQVLSGGTVDTLTDGEVYGRKSRGKTENGNQFSITGVVNPGVGNCGHVQLWNPAGSGKYAYIHSIKGYTSQAAGNLIYLSKYNTQFTAVSSANNKNNGSTSQSSCVLSTRSNTATTGDQLCNHINSVQYQEIELIESSPVRLSPGEGAHVFTTVTNIIVGATFSFEELSA